MIRIKEEFNRWKNSKLDDTDLINELMLMKVNQINDSFYRDLEFGTGGIRGIIGAGTNRINIYTIAKVTQGIADYINAKFGYTKRKVAISRDSRKKSDLFAKVAAEVFAANGIAVYIYKEILPVPLLSFAVRRLNCCLGVMITASHNPSKYNGYKVYGSDGCQITIKEADSIYSYIQKIDVLTGFNKMPFDEGLSKGLISYISSSVIVDYIKEIKKQSLLGNEQIDKGISIIYSPLNGTGLKPIIRVLSDQGYSNIIVVREQEEPNGDFPTCPYPNPEIKEALLLGIEYCKRYNADLMLATDPDCDRVGIAVKNENGEYDLLTGNEVGILLLDYICSRRIELGIMPINPIMIKTIVTIDLAEKIASSYGVKTINVLTGFKYIGEQIGHLEKGGRESDYIFGFEESYGYLTGTYVRDKDGVNASTMIVEMFAYYKTKGISLLDKLQELWSKYGYCLNSLHSFEFPGESGFKKMRLIMEYFRRNKVDIPGIKIKEIQDYENGINDLPKSNVLKFIGVNFSIVLRPSGTEPKLKVYLSICGKDRIAVSNKEKKIASYLKSIICD